MAEVTLIDFLYLNRLALSTFTEVGPQFSNQDSGLGPVIEKAKKLSTLQYPRSISVTSAILISKVQPCPTSSSDAHGAVQRFVCTQALTLKLLVALFYLIVQYLAQEHWLL